MPTSCRNPSAHLYHCRMARERRSHESCFPLGVNGGFFFQWFSFFGCDFFSSSVGVGGGGGVLFSNTIMNKN